MYMRGLCINSCELWLFETSNTNIRLILCSSVHLFLHAVVPVLSNYAGILTEQLEVKKYRLLNIFINELYQILVHLYL